MFLFLLALTACIEIQFTKGRQLKEVKEYNLQVTGQTQISQKMTPADHGFSSSEVSRSDDFRPTTPGNSPGVGHDFATQNMQPKVQDFSSINGQTDFRPTGPGHSPGVGHSFRNVNAGPNA
ncbi:hypothetical protein ACJIZ3_014875 [Penstemon smallii]|uniref:Uncharacterized protein n=1 Tax=Penstemon smallii TaxID=265156 RepID=A0ABD3RN69_9LAMI